MIVLQKFKVQFWGVNSSLPQKHVFLNQTRLTRWFLLTSLPLARAKPPPRRSTIPHGNFFWTTFQLRSRGADEAPWVVTADPINSLWALMLGNWFLTRLNVWLAVFPRPHLVQNSGTSLGRNAGLWRAEQREGRQWRRLLWRLSQTWDCSQWWEWDFSDDVCTK